ncbi:hypothetical protein DMENIID0001_065510 [Sergentomyia squamirostris]
MASVLLIFVVSSILTIASTTDENSKLPSAAGLEVKTFDCVPFIIGCNHYNRYCRFGHCLPKQTAGGKCDYKTPCRVNLACINKRCQKIRQKNRSTTQAPPATETTQPAATPTTTIPTTITETTTVTTTTTSTTTETTTTTTTTTSTTTEKCDHSHESDESHHHHHHHHHCHHHNHSDEILTKH